MILYFQKKKNFWVQAGGRMLQTSNFDLLYKAAKTPEMQHEVPLEGGVRVVLHVGGCLAGLLATWIACFFWLAVWMKAGYLTDRKRWHASGWVGG